MSIQRATWREANREQSMQGQGMAHSNSRTGLLSSVIQRRAFRQELYGDMKGDRTSPWPGERHIEMR